MIFLKSYFIFLLTTEKVEEDVTAACDWAFCGAVVVGSSQSHLVTCSDSSATACAFVLMASSTPFTMFESSVLIDLFFQRGGA